MTFVDAIKKIFIQNYNTPMTAKELWKNIEAQNLVETTGKTPWASINTICLKYCINTTVAKSNKTKILEIVENNPMKFRLLQKSDNIELTNTEQEISEILEDSEKILLYQITSKTLDWKKLSIYNHNENIVYELSDCEEFTYIMKDDAHATLKIGKTKNDPELRLNQLKTGNPSISLLHVFPSSQLSESDLHAKFNDFRKDLEWFFNAKLLKDFFEIEIKRTNLLINSYKKRVELDDLESEMISSISN